jgi:hypothetical protein
LTAALPLPPDPLKPVGLFAFVQPFDKIHSA